MILSEKKGFIYYRYESDTSNEHKGLIVKSKAKKPPKHINTVSRI